MKRIFQSSQFDASLWERLPEFIPQYLEAQNSTDVHDRVQTQKFPPQI
jgi:hypothetical protein